MFNQKQIKSLEDTAQVLQINPGLILECVNKFNDIPYSQSEELAGALKTKAPQLFASNLSKSDDAKEQELIKKHSKLISSLNTEADVQAYLADATADLHELQTGVLAKLDQDKVCVSARVKSPKSILSNIKQGNSYTLTDVIGVRVIPKNNKDMRRLTEQLEEALQSAAGFKLNILAYTRQQATERISPSSVHYKAIHYYTPTSHYNSEIQLRGIYTDIWAELNHKLVYKPVTDVDQTILELIPVFGEMCNVVDFAEFAG